MNRPLLLSYGFVAVTIISYLVYKGSFKTQEVMIAEIGTPAAASLVKIGARELVASPSENYPMTIPWSGGQVRMIDAPLVTFINKGVRYWLSSRGLDQSKYQGSLNKPFNVRMWTKPSHLYFSDPVNQLGGPFRKIDDKNWEYDGGEPWIVNLYQINDSELLAFVHTEQGAVVNGVYGPGRSSIALAYSNNAGDSFTYLGDIIQYYTDKEEYNVQGAPYFIKDGYFFLYYHDLCPTATTALARAPVAEVIAAARQGKTSPWKKYSENWSSPGLGGACVRLGVQPGIDHTDAMYSTFTKKYYMLLSQGAYGPGIDTWIKLFESIDGISWKFVTDIVKEPYPSKGYQYVTVVDESGNDNSVVGKSFYVYSAFDIPNASVYRWLVTFEDTTAAPTITPSPSPTRIPGDVTDAGDTPTDQVNVFDYNALLTGFGTTYTIFDYNKVIANYSR